MNGCRPKGDVVMKERFFSNISASCQSGACGLRYGSRSVGLDSGLSNKRHPARARNLPFQQDKGER